MQLGDKKLRLARKILELDFYPGILKEVSRMFF